MGKISELDMAIRDLRTAASTINNVADTLAEMFTSKEDETSAPAEQAENADTSRHFFTSISTKNSRQISKEKTSPALNGTWSITTSHLSRW